MHNCSELEYLDLSKNKRISGQVYTISYSYFLKVNSNTSGCFLMNQLVTSYIKKQP